VLYPTLNQPIILLVVFVSGLASGLIFDIFKIIVLLSGNDKITKHFFDFLATMFSFLLLFFVNLYFNFGQFRLYVIIVFLISFTLQRLFSKFLWTKLLSKWYSSIARRKKRGRKKEKAS